MLLVLLKSVKNWVFDLLFNNKIADNDTTLKLYFGEKIDEGNEE